jgi:hypothetical protein
MILFSLSFSMHRETLQTLTSRYDLQQVAATSIAWRRRSKTHADARKKLRTRQNKAFETCFLKGSDRKNKRTPSCRAAVMDRFAQFFAERAQ